MLRLLRLDSAIARHVWKNRQDANLERLVKGTYVGRWPFCLFAGHFREGLKKLFQRPPYPGPECQPKLFGDFVANRAVWPSTCNVSKILSEKAPAIWEEFCRLENSHHDDINTKNLTAQGRWDKVHLVSHRIRHTALDVCPVTRGVIDSIPFCSALGSAYFSIMAPGTIVRPHFGPTNFRIRYHLGLQVSNEDGAWLQVANGMYRWHQGYTLAFSDAYKHAVRIDPEASRRVVLIVDIYHPDLTPQEQQFLEEIQAIHEHHFPSSERGLH